MSAHQATQNKGLFSPQSILVYDPEAGICTIWTSEPSSDTEPVSGLTDQKSSHILAAQRDPENKKSKHFIYLFLLQNVPCIRVLKIAAITSNFKDTENYILNYSIYIQWI